MSISPALLASARSAYRDLYRASAATFSGDDTVLKAFRLKMRTETLDGRTQTDLKLYEEKLKYAREVAEILRRNVVQAVKEQEREHPEERWLLRLTKDTELGSNETIKASPPMESSRRARKQEKNTERAIDAALRDPSSTMPRYYSALKKAHQERSIPELKEEDIEESFVRGSGPGGQSINKTENNVQLLHTPTGIRVNCQETRSLQTNRMLARRLLLGRLDKMQNPGLSKEDMKRAKQIERERRRRKKAKKKERSKSEVQDEGTDHGKY